LHYKRDFEQFETEVDRIALERKLIISDSGDYNKVIQLTLAVEKEAFQNARFPKVHKQLPNPPCVYKISATACRANERRGNQDASAMQKDK
jgi:hypothetical protein